MLPADAVIAITSRCNARCSMCRVWQSNGRDCLRPAHIAKLPKSLRTVNITGGEPFLHPQLPDFVSSVRRHLPGAIATISTNGLLSGRIGDMAADLLARDRHLRIAVSLDGPAEIHDRIRGVPGAFDRAIETIERLKEIGFTGLRMAMTLSQANSDQLLPMADLASKFDLELSFVPAHSSAVHFLNADIAPPNPEVLLPQLETFVSRLLRSASPKMWLRAHFADRVGKYVTDQPLKFLCRAGNNFFFLQADGTIYPCNVCSEPLGNITQTDFRKIWFSPQAALSRERAAKCSRQCWMVCTARSYYRAHPVAVLLWILVHKSRAHLRSLFSRHS